MLLSSIVNISCHQLEEHSSRNYRQQKQSFRISNNDNIRYACPKCQRSYRHVHHMLRHYKFECGIPPRFQCPYCGMKSKQSNNVYKHIRAKHPGSKLEIVRLNFQHFCKYYHGRKRHIPAVESREERLASRVRVAVRVTPRRVQLQLT